MRMDQTPEPLHRELRRHLEAFIADESRTMLPGERELMTAFSVSRTTVRRAVQSLVLEGLVRPEHGKGNRIVRAAGGTGQTGGKILLLLREDAGRYQLEAFETLLGALADAGRRALSCIVREGASPAEVAAGALTEAEGVILDDRMSEDEGLYDLLARTGKRAAVLRHRSRRFPYPFAAEDKEDAFRQLVRHLAGLGHRRIVCVSILRDELRLAGYRRGLEDAGLAFDPELLIESYGRTEGGFRSAGVLLEKNLPFTAIIAQNDECALGIMHRLMLAGIRIPQEVSLTGYDNLREGAGYPIPLTSCGGDLRQLCAAVVGHVTGQRPLPESGLLVAARIQPRSSTARL